MALTVTPGGPNDDSLIDRSDLEQIWTDLGLDKSTKSDDEVDISARSGTLYIEGRYCTQWPGTKTNARAQSRDWQRTGAKDRDGNLIDSATIPREVELAVAIAAFFELFNPGGLTKSFTPGTAKTLTQVDKIRWTAVVVDPADAQSAFRVYLPGADDAICNVLKPVTPANSLFMRAVG